MRPWWATLFRCLAWKDEEHGTSCRCLLPSTHRHALSALLLLDSNGLQKRLLVCGNRESGVAAGQRGIQNLQGPGFGRSRTFKSTEPKVESRATQRYHS